MALVFGMTVVGCDEDCTHYFNSWVEHTQPTQTQSGEEYRSCMNCGFVEYRTIPPIGGGGNGGGNNNPTPLNASSARTLVQQAFTQAGFPNFWVRDGVWNSATNTYTTTNIGEARNGAFQGTSAQFSYRHEVEVSFSNGNTNATITGVRYRIIVYWGNAAFATYVGLGQAPSNSNPLIEPWQNSSISGFANVNNRPVGSTVVIRGTTGVITF
jgi:hypothetical protein